MYSENQKNEFAFLRAEGVSFNFISQKLNVPVRTLFRWANDMSDDISNLKIAAYESAADSLKASAQFRIHSLIKDLNRINKKINNMDFNFIDTMTLLNIKIKIHNELLKYENKIYFSPSEKKLKKETPDVIDADVVNNSGSDEKNSGESSEMS